MFIWGMLDDVSLVGLFLRTVLPDKLWHAWSDHSVRLYEQTLSFKADQTSYNMDVEVWLNMYMFVAYLVFRFPIAVWLEM